MLLPPPKIKKFFGEKEWSLFSDSLNNLKKLGLDFTLDKKLITMMEKEKTNLESIKIYLNKLAVVKNTKVWFELQEKNEKKPKNTLKPEVYHNKEIKKEVCNYKFVSRIIHNDCDPQPLKKGITRKYKGELLYLLFPGTTWTETQTVREIRRSQGLFSKYCIFLNFKEAKINSKKKRELEEWYSNWMRRFEFHLFRTHNPKLTKAEKEIRVKNGTVPKGLFTEFNKKMLEVQGLSRAGRRKGLVIFIDQYIAETGRLSRASANHKHIFQIGISKPDSNVPHILSHELIHLLGKRRMNMGGYITWDHKSNCPKALSRAPIRKWYQTNGISFAGRFLEVAEYREIIINRGAKKLLKRIR